MSAPDEAREAARLANPDEALQRCRAASLRGDRFPCMCDYDGPQWIGSPRCAHCGGLLPDAAAADALRHCTGATRVTARTETRHADGTLTVDGEAVSENVPAFEPTPATTHINRAADALSELAADVEQGFTRLTSYPSELPSLEELAAAVQAIETARTFTHDQLTAFSRMAADASLGFFADGNGATASISLETLRNGAALVTVDGERVARIDAEGAVTYYTNGPLA